MMLIRTLLEIKDFFDWTVQVLLDKYYLYIVDDGDQMRFQYAFNKKNKFFICKKKQHLFRTLDYIEQFKNFLQCSWIQ